MANDVPAGRQAGQAAKPPARIADVLPVPSCFVMTDICTAPAIRLSGRRGKPLDALKAWAEAPHPGGKHSSTGIDERQTGRGTAGMIQKNRHHPPARPTSSVWT